MVRRSASGGALLSVCMCVEAGGSQGPNDTFRTAVRVTAAKVGVDHDDPELL